MVVDKHGGDVPSDVDELLALPGIGDYTARAVAAFAYGQRVPVVDTNVRRVYSRWKLGRFLPGAASKRDLAQVEALLPQEPQQAADMSVALMELGALVCTATSPDCDACPLIKKLRMAVGGLSGTVCRGTGAGEEACAKVHRYGSASTGPDHGCAAWRHSTSSAVAYRRRVARRPATLPGTAFPTDRRSGRANA